MAICTPPETYGRMIQYGVKKSHLTNGQLFLQGVAAGIWVGVYGHACTYISGLFYVPTALNAMAIPKLVYACIFPGALFAIIFTGSELFTGNTMTMLMCVLSEQTSVNQLCRVWGLSLVGNFIGAATSAGFSVLSAAFESGQLKTYVDAMVAAKVAKSWGSTCILGIGCNSLVCLGIWCAVASDDTAGKILNMWFPILAFAAGGFEHIVANFYTLMLGVFNGAPAANGFDVVFFNFAPVLTGNLIAGLVVTGLIWWYNFHPISDELDLKTEKQLMAGLVRRLTRAGDLTMLEPLKTPATSKEVV